MQRASLIAREDTLLGVCQGLGEDIGIPPQLLRVAFAGLLFWNPMAAIATYLAAGLFVAALRFLVPNPRVAAAAAQAEEEAAEPASVPAPAAVEAQVRAEPVALAA